MSDLFQIENFRKQLNTMFIFQAEGLPPISVELVEVESRGHTIEGRGKENFTLLFNDTVNPSIGQGPVAVTHPALGEFNLFIVPVVPDRPGVCYETVLKFLPENEGA